MAFTTIGDVIEKFELYAGDETELSTSEELDLVQKKINQILDEHDWSFLNKPFTGTTSVSVDYIALPTDFKSMMKNKNGNSVVVYVGTNYDPYTVIPYDQRRNYRNQKGYCYVDTRQKRLYFTMQPTSADSVEFDYLYIPTDVTTATTLADLFPNGARFADAIYHAMLTDNDIIQMSDKARSYGADNLAEYTRIINDMKYADFKNTGMLDYGIA